MRALSAGLTVAELAVLVFPRVGPYGALSVLTAYFDDSGTHAGSPVVLIGGLLGTCPQWERFEKEWKQRLREPLPGKRALRRFHMYDCEHGEGEFAGWNRAERDHLIYLLRQIIIDSHLFGYTCAISRPFWDAIIVGDLRAFLGDAERYAVTSAILRTLEHAKRLAPGDKVAFVFDNRPHREEANRRVFEIYQRLHGIGGQIPEPTRIVFESSTDTVPLQGADMFAWETYQYSKNWLEKGGAVIPRPHLKGLMKGIDAQVQVAGRDAIEKMARYLSQNPTLRDLATYFDSV